MKKNLILSLLTGILLALSFPPFKTGFLAYGALIPFFLLLEEKSLGQAVKWGYITGLLFYSGTVFWIGVITVPGAIGTLLIMPLYTTLFAVIYVWLLGRIGRNATLALPFLWTSIEYLKSLTDLAFPWNYVGYTQSYYLPLIQWAEFVSIHGISLWVVTLNVLLFILYKEYKNAELRKRLIIFLIVLFVLPMTHGIFVLTNTSDTDENIDVTLIQGNIDPIAKWEGNIYELNYNAYEQMTLDALKKQETDLIIWPETAMPFFLRGEEKYLNRIHHLVDSTETPLLTGGIDYGFTDDGESMHYNAAYLFEPVNRYVQRYHKIKLVPFSERVPYKQHFPFKYLRNVLYDYGTGDYAKGDSISVYSFRSKEHYQMGKRSFIDKDERYKTALAICYESVFPDHVRYYAKKDADFFLIITNDAWFGNTSAPYQHTQIAVFRAIENRRDIARCANTGISCIIDKYGHVRKQTKLFEKAVITDKVELNDEKTFYTKHGNILAKFTAVMSVIFMVIALLKKVE